MAWSFNLNVFPSTGGKAIWELKEFLVGQGWNVARSGNGIAAYNASGDVHAPGGPYAGSLDNSNAWLELQQPVAATPRRSFLLQNSSSTTWPTWYSSDGTGFTGGSPSASARPTAADEQGIMNTGWPVQWLPGNGAYRVDMLAGGAAEGFGFFFGARPAYDGYSSVLSLDGLTEADPLDADPAIVGTNFIYDTRFALNNAPLYYAVSPSQTSGISMGWYQKGLGSPAFVVYPATFIGGGEGFGSNMVPLNADRITQKTDNSFVDFPIWYWRGGGYTTERGKKGRSTLYRASQPRYGIFRPNQTLTVMSLGALSIPWDGVTIPTL